MKKTIELTWRFQSRATKITISSNLFRFGFTRSNCSDGEPSNKRKNNGEGSIQASESSTQSQGSDKATSSRIQATRNTFRLEYYPRLFPDNLEYKHKRKLMKRFLFCRYYKLYFICLYRMFRATKILPRATSIDCKALLPEGQQT